MPGATLLDIVQTAAIELGLVPPSSVAASADPQTQQLYYLVNRTGNQLRRDWGWTQFQREWTIAVGPPLTTTGDTTVSSAVITNIADTTGVEAGYWVCTGNNIPVAARVQSVDSATQVTLNMEATATAVGSELVFAQDTYDEPTDFDRFTNRTMWDRTNRWELIGPDSPQFWQWQVSGIVTVGPRRHFRQIGIPNQNFRLWPPPAVLDTPFQLAFEYISNGWVRTALDTYQSEMTADDDESLLDPNAIVLGVKWRYFQIKQFDYAPLQMEYNDYVAMIAGQNGGAPTLSLTPMVSSPFISPANVQDANWPSSPSGS